MLKTSMSRKAVETWAKIHDKELKATDFNSNSGILVQDDEGGVYIWKSAFYRIWNSYLIVFTEHHGYHIFHKEDLLYFSVIDNQLCEFS